MTADKKENRLLCNVFKRLILLAISVFAVVLFIGCAVNEEKKVRRVDDQGYLYYIDYDKDYYSSEVIQRMRELEIIDPEECMADNFAYAIVYGLNGQDGKGYNSPEIIEGIIDYLKQ